MRRAAILLFIAHSALAQLTPEQALQYARDIVAAALEDVKTAALAVAHSKTKRISIMTSAPRALR